MKYSIIVLSLVYLGVLSSSQNTTTYENNLDYEINRVRPPLSISKKVLNEANTLMDLNKHYKSSWVREYISVEVLAIHNGKITKVTSENHNLSEGQKSIMQKADVGSEIEITVSYIPENTLKNNEPKEANFAFVVNPENAAEYILGEDKLQEYLQQNAIDKIPNDVFKEYDLAAIKFTVTEKGQITNAHIFESSKDENVDKLLLSTISNMKDWQPAEYANGTKVKQDFVLTVGNHQSCIINLLNIGRLSFETKD